MNLDLIGKENLPNAYIDRITINKTSEAIDKDLLLNVRVCVYDAIKTRRSKKPYFSAFRNNSKKSLFIVVSNSKEFTQAVLNGVEEFNPSYIKKIQGYSKDLISTEIIQANKERLKYRKVKKISWEVRPKTLKRKTGHIAVFVCVLKPLLNSYSNGPITSDIIMEKSEVKQISHYYTTNNKIWYGPIHSNDDVQMAGSFHTIQPHAKLNKQLTTNTKIIDNRTNKIRIDNSNLNIYRKDKLLLKNYHLSDLKTGQNSLLGMYYSFNINTKKICKDYFLKNLSESRKDFIVDQVISECKVKNMNVFYKKHKKQNYKLSISSKQHSNILSSRERYDNDRLISSIKEEVLHKDISRKTYTGQINDNKVESVKISIQVNNPFMKYYKRLYSSFKTSMNNLKIYEALLNKKDYYNKDYNSTTQIFIESFYSRKELWIEPIKNYKKLLFLCTNADNKTISIETKRLFMLLNPKNLTKSSIQQVLEDFRLYTSIFYKKFDLSVKNRFGKNKSKRNTRDKIIIEKEFHINFKAKRKLISYTPGTLNGDIPKIKTTTLKNLFNSDINKYKITQREDPRFANLLSRNKKDFSYLGPIMIQDKEDKINLSNFDSIDENEISDFALKTDGISLDNKLFSNLYVVKYKNITNNLVDPTKQIGKDSPFQLNLDSADKSNSFTTNMFERKNIFSKKQRPSQNDQHTYNRDKSVIFKNRSMSSVKDIPVQIKDLITKDTIMGKDKKVFLKENRYTKSLLYENLVSIHFNPDEKRDSDGNIILNYNNLKPMYINQLESLTAPVVCYIRKYDMKKLSDGVNEFEKFGILNSLFILIPDSWSYTRSSDEVIQDREIESLYSNVKETLSIPDISMRTADVVQTKNRRPSNLAQQQSSTTDTSTTNTGRQRTRRTRSSRGRRGRY